MIDKPLVSILMPAYNAEKYISAAIKSILNQTFTDFELVIINDGSIDNTENVIKSFSDFRIKYFKQENRGVARTLNNGIKKCKGRYIRRHDADDISSPDSLKKQVEFIEKHKDIALVGTRQLYMTKNGKVSKKYGLPNDTFFNDANYKEVTFDDFTYESSSPVVHGSVLFEKELVERLGGYRTAFLTSEDNDLWIRILEHKRIVVLNYKGYFQRLHDTSATKTHNSSLLFYRRKVKDFALERKNIGSDPLLRGEEMPKPIIESPKLIQNIGVNGKSYRKELDFLYRIYVNANDWKLVFKTIRMSLKDGWKLKRTWKAVIFPLLGEKLVLFGVLIKTRFKK